MDNFTTYLKTKLELGNYVLVKATTTKLVIFKCFNKFTKCIYINLLSDCIEVRIDKVFDNRAHYKHIERMIICKRQFTSIDDSVNYIQENIV